MFYLTVVVTSLDAASLAVYFFAYSFQTLRSFFKNGPAAASARAWWIDLADDVLVEVPALCIAAIQASATQDWEGFVLAAFSTFKLLSHFVKVVAAHTKRSAANTR